MDLNRASRYLSYLLRHHPEAAGITLDAHGWADVDQLLAGMKKHRITRAQLEEIVAADQKQRYAFDERRTKIRANQNFVRGSNSRVLPRALTRGLRRLLQVPVLWETLP